MNDLLEFGSACDVYIKNKTNTKINNKQYVSGELYTILKNVEVVWDYINNNNEFIGKRTHIMSSEIYPSGLFINNVQLNSKIMYLVSTKQGNENTLITYTDVLEAYNIENEVGTEYLLPKHMNIENIFVYDALDFEKITDFTYEDGVIKSESFELGAQYFVTYCYSNIADIYSLEQPDFPYFDLEIHFKGNTDKKTSSNAIFVKKCKLITSLNINNLNHTNAFVGLQFQIIDSNKDSCLLALLK